MPVTTSLHERFRGVGRELLDLLSLYDSLNVSGAEWIPVEGSSPVSAAGADSSRQVEVYRGVIIYAVQGYAILVSRDGFSDRVEDASVATSRSPRPPRLVLKLPGTPSYHLRLRH